MPMPFQPWRAALLPASLGGAGFHVETGSRASGRRIALHEYPKADTPYAEDMGRKAVRWSLAAYCIGSDYETDRDALIAVCEEEGPATLIHPSMGEMQVVCDGYSVTEFREKGGFCGFELQLTEAGESPDNSVTNDTQSQVNTAAANSDQAASNSLDAGLQDPGSGYLASSNHL